METKRSSSSIAWIIFLISTIGLITAIYLHWEWLTLILPIMLTSFVKAMDIM